MREPYVYTSVGLRVLHFFIGLIVNGWITIGWAISFMSISYERMDIAIVITIVVLVLELVGLLYFFTSKKYIAVGMLSGILLPLLLVGGCFMLANSIL